MELSQFASLISGLGTTGVLIVIVWAFFTRKIISEKSHEEALQIERIASEQAAKIASKEICDKIEDGVARGIERGIVRGILKINGDV
jgi:hypothetical protein